MRKNTKVKDGDAYWDKLWARQERVVAQAKTPAKLRDSGRAESIDFFPSRRRAHRLDIFLKQ